jgi:uncharacterized protein (DUF4415 family)
MNISPNRLEELQNIPDSEIDTSDIPELDSKFWGTAKMKPNRFAVQSEKKELKVVALDEDVAEVFKTSESVNKVLRALIDAMPQSITATYPEKNKVTE